MVVGTSEIIHLKGRPVAIIFISVYFFHYQIIQNFSFRCLIEVLSCILKMETAEVVVPAYIVQDEGG